MKKLERAGWQDATTLAELGELTALWLEGSIPEQPGYFGAPDPETKPLIRTLAHANRCGYLTDGSQPGYDGPGYDGRPAQQRAAVSGFADPATTRWLIRTAGRAGAHLFVIINRAGWRTTYRKAIPVSQWGGQTTTTFGEAVSRRHIASVGYAGCNAAAIAVLQAATQVTLIDPEWGRNDVLWPLLDRMPALRRRAA